MNMNRKPKLEPWKSLPRQTKVFLIYTYIVIGVMIAGIIVFMVIAANSLVK
jgi:hypothetical protein